MAIRIVDTLVDSRNALLMNNTVEDIFRGETEIEIEMNEYLRGGVTLGKINNILVGETGNAVIDDIGLHQKIPKARYYGVELPRIKALTENVTGCKSEEELHDLIENEIDEKDPKIKTLYNNMARWVKNNPSTILRNALLTGLGIGFLAYLKYLQNEETGCFRYDNEGNREKIPERSCLGNKNGLRGIPHPLDGISWDCSYDITPLIPFDTKHALPKGCKGICNPYVYNTLCKHASYPAWVPTDAYDKYYYVCEKGTFIRTLAKEIGMVGKEILQGLDDAHIFDYFKNTVLPVLILLVLIYFGCSFVVSCSLAKFFNYIIYNRRTKTKKRRL